MIPGITKSTLCKAKRNVLEFTGMWICLCCCGLISKLLNHAHVVQVLTLHLTLSFTNSVAYSGTFILPKHFCLLIAKPHSLYLSNYQLSFPLPLFTLPEIYLNIFIILCIILLGRFQRKLLVSFSLHTPRQPLLVSGLVFPGLL